MVNLTNIFEHLLGKMPSRKKIIESSVELDIQQIIHVIERMKDCLTLFTTYSDQFGTAMLDSHWNRRDGPKFVDSENSVYVGRLQHELDEHHRKFLEQKQSIEARNQSFSKEYLLQTIFSCLRDFSQYFSFMKGFKNVMEEDITNRFYDTKSSFVQFLRTQIEIRTDFVIEIRSNDLDFTGCDDFNVMRKFLETYPVEPFIDLREQLERELEAINFFRL